MVSKTGEAESITSHYLFALGVYRALYILNWIYRFYGEGFYDLIAIIAGIVQIGLELPGQIKKFEDATTALKDYGKVASEVSEEHKENLCYLCA